MYLKNIRQIIDSSVEPTILWIAKQKIIYKQSYQTDLYFCLRFCLYSFFK